MIPKTDAQIELDTTVEQRNEFREKLIAEIGDGKKNQWTIREITGYVLERAEQEYLPKIEELEKRVELEDERNEKIWMENRSLSVQVKRKDEAILQLQSTHSRMVEALKGLNERYFYSTGDQSPYVLRADIDKIIEQSKGKE